MLNSSQIDRFGVHPFDLEAPLFGIVVLNPSTGPLLTGPNSTRSFARMRQPIQVVSLRTQYIRRFSKTELLDLSRYLDPDLFLVVDEAAPRRIRWLEKVTERPVIPAHRPGRRQVQGIELLVAPRLEDLRQHVTSESPSGADVILSSFLQQRTDPDTFSLHWENLDPYLELLGDARSALTHLAANLPPGERVSPDDLPTDVRIHGAGFLDGPYERAFPSLRVQEDVRIQETLQTQKLGIRAIQGIGWDIEKQLRDAQVSDRQTLITMDPTALMEIDGIGPYYASVLRAGAHALNNQEPVWFADDPLRDRERVYVDIETDSLQPNVIWQIGVYDEKTDHYRAFHQREDPTDASYVPRAFARWVHNQARDRTFVSWFGNRFDFVWLRRFVREHAEPSWTETWESVAKVDLLEDVIKPGVCLPVRTHKLNVVAARLGYEHHHPGLTGEDAARAYSRWCSGGELDWSTWIEYCRDDVMAMHHVYHRMTEGPKLVDRTELESLYERMGDPEQRAAPS